MSHGRGLCVVATCHQNWGAGGRRGESAGAVTPQGPPCAGVHLGWSSRAGNRSSNTSSQPLRRSPTRCAPAPWPLPWPPPWPWPHLLPIPRLGQDGPAGRLGIPSDAAVVQAVLPACAAAVSHAAPPCPSPEGEGWRQQPYGAEQQRAGGRAWREGRGCVGPALRATLASADSPRPPAAGLFVPHCPSPALALPQFPACTPQCNPDQGCAQAPVHPRPPPALSLPCPPQPTPPFWWCAMSCPPPPPRAAGKRNSALPPPHRALAHLGAPLTSAQHVERHGSRERGRQRRSGVEQRRCVGQRGAPNAHALPPHRQRCACGNGGVQEGCGACRQQAGVWVKAGEDAHPHPHCPCPRRRPTPPPTAAPPSPPPPHTHVQTCHFQTRTHPAARSHRR